MAKHILQPKKEEDKDRYSSLVKSVTKSASFAVSERPTNIFYYNGVKPESFTLITFEMFDLKSNVVVYKK